VENLTLLIVDDEESILKSLTRTLADEGLNILTALSGNQALKKLEKNKVDLIISDQRMPQMSGIEFLTRVQDEHPNIITMMLTAYADIDVAIKAINDIGIYKFILKPWDEIDLKLTIAKAKRLSTLLKTDTILKEDVLDYNDKTVFASLKEKTEKKTDPVLEKAVEKGMTDYGQAGHRITDFDRDKFDLLKYSAFELEEIFNNQDLELRKKIKGDVVDVLYDRYLSGMIGINYSNLTGEDNIKAYKYVMYTRNLLKA